MIGIFAPGGLWVDFHCSQRVEDYGGQVKVDQRGLLREQPFVAQLVGAV